MLPFAHLFRYDHKRISVFRQEVENTPDFESIFVGDEHAVVADVLTGAQRPAHFIQLLEIKLALDLGLQNSPGMNSFNSSISEVRFIFLELYTPLRLFHSLLLLNHTLQDESLYKDLGLGT